MNFLKIHWKKIIIFLTILTIVITFAFFYIPNFIKKSYIDSNYADCREIACDIFLRNFSQHLFINEDYYKYFCYTKNICDDLDSFRGHSQDAFIGMLDLTLAREPGKVSKCYSCNVKPNDRFFLYSESAGQTWYGGCFLSGPLYDDTLLKEGSIRISYPHEYMLGFMGELFHAFTANSIGKTYIIAEGMCEGQGLGYEINIVNS
jgi:hypothetical protein